jgi:hypothetical protein
MSKNSSFSVSIKLLAEIKKFQSNMTAAQSTIKSFEKGVNRAGGAIAGAFTAGAIWSFTKDATMAAAKIEGIEKAFDKLNRPDLLDQLRGAARGTVNDLELMQKAVEANNFKIPLDNLAGMMEFARRRAKDTGRDASFFFESLILGMSRQSIMILDNVGLSAKQIRDEQAKTGDFAKAVNNIVTQGLKQMGAESVTTSDKLGQIQTRFDNIKVSVGKVITESNYFNGILKEIDRTLYNLSASDFDKKMAPIMGDIAIEGTTAKKRIEAVNGQLQAQKKELDQIISKEARLANTRSKAFKNDKGIFDQSKVTAWAEKRLKDNERYKLQLEVIKKLEQEKAKAEQALEAESTKVIKKKYDTIEGIGREITALEALRNKAHGKELSQLNVEIKKLEEKRKALQEQGLNSTSTHEVKLLDMPKLDLTDKDDLSLDVPLTIEDTGLIEVLQMKLEKLRELRDKSFDTAQIQEYNQQMALTNEELSKLTSNQVSNNNELQEMSNTMGAFGNMIGSVNGMMNQFQEDSVQSWMSLTAVILQSITQTIKALQAQAVAGAISSGAKVGFPMNLVAIGTGVATVLQAFSKLPAFENGGIIDSPFTHGDKTLVRANGGEMMLNHGQQSNLFRMLNNPAQSGNSVGGEVVFRIGERELVGILSKHSRKSNSRR